MAGRYDFTITQGMPLSRTLVWKDKDGNPVNLTGKTASLVAKARKTDTIPVMNLTHVDGLLLGGTAGTVTISHTLEKVNSLNFKYAGYDLFIGDHHLVTGEITYRKSYKNA